jgi:hypothetical protein
MDPVRLLKNDVHVAAMRTYLITTGLLFGVITALHIWRAIAEWPHLTANFPFALGMSALVALPGILSWWAWRLVRTLPK